MLLGAVVTIHGMGDVEKKSGWPPFEIVAINGHDWSVAGYHVHSM